MNRLQHIVTALTPKGGDDHVFTGGELLAETTDTNHSVVSVLPAPVKINRGLATLGIEFDADEIQAAKQAIPDRCIALGLQSKNLHIVRGGKAIAAAEWVNDNNAGVVCVGIHKEDGLGYFLGTTATGLLRHADSAIFGCHANQALRFKKILLAVDVDEHLPALLEQVAALQKYVPNAELHVLSAFRPIEPYTSELNSSVVRSFSNQARAAKSEHIDGYLSSAHIRYKDLDIRVGVPSAVIKTTAQELGVDLIIMSTGQHLGFGWHIGSTTNNVMHGVQTNVLAFRPKA